MTELVLAGAPRPARRSREGGRKSGRWVGAARRDARRKQWVSSTVATGKEQQRGSVVVTKAR